MIVVALSAHGGMGLFSGTDVETRGREWDDDEAR